MNMITIDSTTKITVRIVTEGPWVNRSLILDLRDEFHLKTR
jgi:hypothetical protein